MKISAEYDYRNAKSVLKSVAPAELDEIYSILTHADAQLDLQAKSGQQRTLSKQIQTWFVDQGWESEKPSVAVPDMRYDLAKENVVLEIEVGHQRLVYPDFFEFLADYSSGHIPAAVMIVTGNPELFGKKWHCSIASTRRKIEAIQGVYLVPTLVIGVDP